MTVTLAPARAAISSALSISLERSQALMQIFFACGTIVEKNVDATLVSVPSVATDVCAQAVSTNVPEGADVGADVGVDAGAGVGVDNGVGLENIAKYAVVLTVVVKVKSGNVTVFTFPPPPNEPAAALTFAHDVPVQNAR